MQLHIVIPVYNDWDSVSRLLPLIEASIRSTGTKADILLVDDGSSRLVPELPHSDDGPMRSLSVLRLRRNLGHQRAICVALCHLLEHSDTARILIMDGDGEDDPSDIPRLIETLEKDAGSEIVFAERLKRSEGWVFGVFYHLYRLLHRICVGHQVRVGNFSLMKRECLERLCTSPELWNHYAASVFAGRTPMSFLPTKRSKRLAGKSQMNFPALVMHGLSALSVFTDRIGTRFLIGAGASMVLTVLGMGIVTGVRLATGYAIPGWATVAFGILGLLLSQIAAFMFSFCFLVLFTRGLSPFIPIRDYEHFVYRYDAIWPKNVN